MVDYDTFNKVYTIASPVQKYLFSSSYSGEQLNMLAKKYNLTERDKYSLFAITVGDMVLGFYKIEDTIPLLQQELEIDQDTAEKLGAEVLEFLAPLSDPSWQPPTDENTEDDDLPTNELAPKSVSAPHTPTHIEEPQHEPIIIPEIRTMAADMATERSPARNTFNAAAEIEEPVYVSNQPTLEKKVVDVPSYSSPLYQTLKPNSPTTDTRWNENSY